MARTKRPELIRLADSDPLAIKMKPGAKIRMSDGWCGAVSWDDGEFVTLIQDGAELHNEKFVGYRGFQRYRTTFGGTKAMCRSPIVDLEKRNIVRSGINVVDRARLESEWDAAPEY